MSVMRSCLLNALCAGAESRLLGHEGKEIAVIRDMYMPGMSLAAQIMASLAIITVATLAIFGVSATLLDRRTVLFCSSELVPTRDIMSTWSRTARM